jgi:hypothetical protein
MKVLYCRIIIEFLWLKKVSKSINLKTDFFQVKHAWVTGNISSARYEKTELNIINFVGDEL